MTLKTLKFKPGITRDTTTYAAEGGFYACDKVRFRSASAEKIGGWQRFSDYTYLGTARDLWNWVTLLGNNYLGIGTERKYYVEEGGAYYDITPIRATAVLNNPFTATNGSSVINVLDVAHGARTGDFVTFANTVTLGGNVTAVVLDQEFELTVVDADNYTITVSVVANATDAAGSPGGGATVDAEYQVNTGYTVYSAGLGWGAGPWSREGWGDPYYAPDFGTFRLWNHSNFGEDLIYGPRGGPLYVWDASNYPPGPSNRGTLITGSDVPLFQNALIVSDQSRFVVVFGTNDIGSSTTNPMLIRWSQREDYTDWTPGPTSSAGSLALSTGSYIVTAAQSRQEIVTWTDSALYSVQYLGVDGFGADLVASNISIMSPKCWAIANNAVYWMGVDKFYVYTGRVDTLPCTIWAEVFKSINVQQAYQVFAGTNEGFNEVWWFYCSRDATSPDKYVIYNTLEQLWTYGTIERTAWLDSGLRSNPMAATGNTMVYHEVGYDDKTTATPAPIAAYLESADFDIEDGEQFAFVWRIIPDVKFDGSTMPNPSVNMTLRTRRNPGAAYSTTPNPVVRELTIDEYTQYAYARVRGRQMAYRIESGDLGVFWQLGAPRIDVQPDGAR